MSTSNRKKIEKPYHHGNLRIALLDAAADILAREGVTKLSLRGVARGAGVSQTAPYRHFKDKAALLAAVAARGFQGLANAMREGAAKHEEPRDRLAEIGRTYIRFALEHDAVFRLMFGPEIPDKSADAELRAAADDAFAALASTAAGFNGEDTTKFQGESDGAPDQAFTAWCFVHGLATLLIDQQIKPELISGATANPIELSQRFGRFFDFSRP